MPRQPTALKTIHGREVSQTVFLKTIAEAIAMCPGGASAADLLPVLGPEHQTGDQRKLLNQSLINLANKGTLRRVEGERGVYEVTNHWRRSGVNLFDEDEQAILRSIRRRGGFCRLRDILDDQDVRPTGDKESRTDKMGETQYQRIMRVIAASDLIRQDMLDKKYGPGSYNAPWHEVSALPLLGKWAALYTRFTWMELHYQMKKEITDRYGWWGERDTFFSNVGHAFRRLREIQGLSIEDVLDVRPIRAAVATAQRANPKLKAIVHSEWHGRIAKHVEEMRAGGEPHEAIEAYREEQDRLLETKGAIWFHKKFENGNALAHYHAPLDLYMAYAARFEVCPAALSRGVILLKPYEDVRLRPTRTRRSMHEIIDAELANEAAIAQTRRLLEMDIDEDEMTGEVPFEEPSGK